MEEQSDFILQRTPWVRAGLCSSSAWRFRESRTPSLAHSRDAAGFRPLLHIALPLPI